MEKETSMSPVVKQFDVISKLYQAICSSINNSPINDETKKDACKFFSTGFMWAREAFNAVIMLEQQQQQPLPSEPASNNGQFHNTAPEDAVTDK